MSRFEGKTVLVTGGTSGIGLATVRRLAEEGANLIVTGTNPDRLDAVRQELPDALVIANDAGDPEAADALAAAIRERFSRVDAAFLNAGFGRFQPLEGASADEFEAQFSVNVRGPLLHSRALAELLGDGGAVVLNTSVGRDLGMPNGIIYGATKGAVRSMVRGLAREFASRGIRVNAVSPGPVATDFFARTGLPGEAIDEFGQAILAQVPLARFAEPREIAAVATFLLSDDASYVTGSEYVVDGGMTEL